MEKETLAQTKAQTPSTQTAKQMNIPHLRVQTQ